MVRLCRFFHQNYGIEPDNITGHRDHLSTACPGSKLYATLPDIRERVRAVPVKPAQIVRWEALAEGVLAETTDGHLWVYQLREETWKRIPPVPGGAPPQTT